MEEKPTEWSSKKPSLEEWEERDAWVLGLIVYNTKNSVGASEHLADEPSRPFVMHTNVVHANKTDTHSQTVHRFQISVDIQAITRKMME